VPTTPVDRRDLILERAAELFARQGVSATTVREIAEAVGILSGSLYHHFGSKDEIVEAIVAGFLHDLLQRYDEVLASGSSAKDRLRGLVRASLDTVVDHPRATEIYQNERHLQTTSGPAVVREGGLRVRSAWTSVLEEGMADGSLRSDVPVRVMYPLLRDSLWLTARWFKPTADYGYRELADDCWLIFGHGVVRPA
jgi:AcrR family transcriptional regulator